MRKKIDLKKVKRDLQQSLDEYPSERKMQAFLERHPFLIPDINYFHHGPLGDLVISKIHLGNDFTSDFCFASANSALVRITFVEIERPNKRIFNKNEEFSQEFNHALQQIYDWDYWCKGHVAEVKEKWAEVIKECGYTQSYVTTGFVLMIGRRQMTTVSSRTRDRWSEKVETLRQQNIELMTYDRLIDHMHRLSSTHLQNKLVTCSYRQQRFVVKGALL